MRSQVAAEVLNTRLTPKKKRRLLTKIRNNCTPERLNTGIREPEWYVGWESKSLGGRTFNWRDSIEGWVFWRKTFFVLIRTKIKA